MTMARVFDYAQPVLLGSLLGRVRHLTPYSCFWMVNSKYRGMKFTTESAEGWLIMDS
jgi:hypothetical protein